MIKVFSKSQCPYCDRAKQLLESKGVSYTEVNIENDPSARQKLIEQGLRSVPQIFKDDELIPGGYNGLAKQSDEFFEQVKGQ